MIGKLFGIREQESEEHWVSISDVMAGLMVIFLFIAISYMVNINRTTAQIKNRLGDYKNLRVDLSAKLYAEFEGTSVKKTQFRSVWRGHLDRETLSIRFKKPFTQGDATVPNEFKNVLRDFFPRYIAILTKPEYRNGIAEIRIEGHTSGEWHREVTFDEAYFKNMELSQNRARNVLRYVLGIRHLSITQNKEWIKKNMTANGLSSSQPILNPYGNENKTESRRVELRVVTKSEKLIDEIQQLLQEIDSNVEVK